MANVLKRGASTENSTVMKILVSSTAELSADAECKACAPGSIAIADDLTFYALKKNDGAWNVVTLDLT